MCLFGVSQCLSLQDFGQIESRGGAVRKREERGGGARKREGNPESGAGVRDSVGQSLREASAFTPPETCRSAWARLPARADLVTDLRRAPPFLLVTAAVGRDDVPP